MSRCPNCGEQVKKGQHACFACGHRMDLDNRDTRGRTPPNPVVLIIAAVAVLAAVVGLVVLLPRRNRKDAAAKQAAELQRVQDSVRSANRAQGSVLPDSAAGDSSRFSPARPDPEVRQLTDEVDRLEARLRQVERVLGGSLTPEQSHLAGSARAELSRLRSKVSSVATKGGDDRRAAVDEVREGERLVRSLIADLARTRK